MIPLIWYILLLSSKNSFGFALVITNVNTKVNVDDIPIATVPEKSVNDAISIAIIAIDKEGINIFNPNFSAFKVANVSSNCFNVPMFICLVAESTAITITSAPTIWLGI